MSRVKCSIDADFRVEALHRARGLQSQQAAAEHHGAAAAHAPREQAMRVAHVAKGVHAGQPDAGISGTYGREPVASTSVEYGCTKPELSRTQRLARSIAVTA